LDSYRSSAAVDRQDTPSFQYYPSAAGGLSYSKTALWLGTLERYLGWDLLQPAMAEFFRQQVFSHPKPEDFFRTINEIAGSDLSWFFDQVYRSSELFDYGVSSAASFPVEPEGYYEGDGGLIYRSDRDTSDNQDASGDSEQVFRTEVVVRRFGSGIFPVDVLLVFEDGEEIRHKWDGAERWSLVVEERAARLEYAAVDPDEVLLLDLRRINNTWVLEEETSRSAVKWASRWMLWFEDFLSMLAFYG